MHGRLPLGEGRDDSRQFVHADALVRAFGKGVAVVRVRVDHVEKRSLLEPVRPGSALRAGGAGV